MAFSEALKEKVKRKACFRCVICHQAFVEVHHIIPQSEGGDDSEDNAAPLCAGCHDLYGGNPEKRRQIRQMRDHWYEEMEKRYNGELSLFDPIPVLDARQRMRTEKGVALYHYVYSHENFEETAQMLFKMVKNARDQFPGKPRYLYLDIEGHRNQAGGFDRDMFELQSHFLPEFLGKYLCAFYVPLGDFEHKAPQQEDMPDGLKIFPAQQ